MGFDALPSVATILQESAIWANAFYTQFSWVINLSVGVSVFVGVVYFLPNLFSNIFNKLKNNNENKDWQNFYTNVFDNTPKNLRGQDIKILGPNGKWYDV